MTGPSSSSTGRHLAICMSSLPIVRRIESEPDRKNPEASGPVASIGFGPPVPNCQAARSVRKSQYGRSSRFSVWTRK